MSALSSVLVAGAPALYRADAPTVIHAPSVSYYALAPILIVLGAALLGVVVEAFVPREERYLAQLVVTIGGRNGGETSPHGYQGG